MGDTINKDSIAFRLRMLRAEYGLTQAEVAERLEITQQTYSKYESQDIKIDSNVIIKLCELYGVTSDYLLGIKSENKKSGKSKPVSYENPKDETDMSEDEIKRIVAEVMAKMKDNN